MSTRYRREIKLGKGSRVNVGKSGVSGLSFGSRGSGLGLTMNTRGTFLNIGIPGTGFSKRIKLSDSPAQVKKKQEELDKKRKKKEKEKLKEEQEFLLEKEKQAELEDAERIVMEYEAHIENLTSVLSKRDKSDFVWEKVLLPPEKPTLPEVLKDNFFPALPKPYDEAKIRLDLQLRKNWLLMLGIDSVKTFDELQKLYDDDYHLSLKASEELKLYVKDVLLEEHQKALKSWEKATKLVNALLQIEDNQDTEALSDLLEFELNNEDWPIDLDFQLEFDGIKQVSIYFNVPSFNLVPDSEYSLTEKRSQLKKRDLLLKERQNLFLDFVSSLALRVLYETFRVLEPIKKVAVFGVGKVINVKNGHLEEINILEINAKRNEFSSVNLDNVEPFECFKALKGKFDFNIIKNMVVE